MNRTSCEKALGAELREPLRALGFAQESRVEFLRKTSFGGQALLFGVRVDPQGLCHVSGTVGVVFRDIEDFLARVDETRSPQTPTILMPLHLLRADRKYFDWLVETPQDIGRVADEILVYVEAFAIPFLARYDHVDAVRTALLQPAPSSWFILSPEQRETILATIEFLSGSSELATTRVDRALDERADEPPKRRRELEALRELLSRSQVANENGPGE